jgi:WD40 repeat protein
MSAGQTWSYDAGDHIAGLVWLPDGHTFAVAPAVGGIALLDRAAGDVRRTLTGHAQANCALSAAGEFLASGGQDGVARLWNTQTGELAHELRASDTASDWCEHVRFSPDGKLLATSAGRTLRVWTRDGGLVFENAAHDSTIAALAWRPDSAGVATGCYNGAQLFRSRDGQWEPHSYEELRWKGSIISLTWSPNGRYVAGGSQEATIQFWKLPYRPGEELFMSGYATKIRELAWDAASRYLASGGGEIITVWDVSGKGPRGTTPKQLEGHTARITQLAFQHRGPLLASGGADGRVFIWDLAKAQRHRHELIPPSPVAALAWSPDDTALAIGAADGSVSVWEARG